MQMLSDSGTFFTERSSLQSGNTGRNNRQQKHVCYIWELTRVWMNQ